MSVIINCRVYSSNVYYLKILKSEEFFSLSSWRLCASCGTRRKWRTSDALVSVPDAGECSPASQPPVAFCGVRRCEGISLSISPNCTDAVASLVLFGLGGVLSYSAAFPDLSEQSIQAIHLPRQCIRLMEKALVSFFFRSSINIFFFSIKNFYPWS